MLPLAVSDHYRAQRRLILATLGLIQREWSLMGEDLDASWAKIGPRVVQLTASAQVGAARNGASYVPATLAELGQSVRGAGSVVPASLVGAQSLDGLTYGSLDDLLYGAVIHARTAPAESLTERLSVGGKWLDRLVHTQVSDASKQSAAVAMGSRPHVGYVRMVNPPCCKRCAVLSGKYSGPQAFPRHPRCDCVAIPTTVANPDEPLGIDISPNQIKDLSAAERKALDEGSDLSQVVNADRGRSKDGMTTTEGRTRRPQGSQRLTPEGIYRVSATREEAIQRLRDNGYLR